MTRKTLITALLFVFILSSCGSNVETIQPTLTSIPTLQATSTFTPEPTATNTPIPTETPFQYTSCLDPQLMEEIKAGFTEKFEMTLDEYIDLIAATGKYQRQFYKLSNGNTQAQYLLIGGSEVSIGHLNGMSESDTAFCLYFVDDSDTSTLFPIVLAFTQGGEWNLTTPIGDNTGDGSVGLSAFTSIDELREWWTSGTNKLNPGDVLMLNYHPFDGVETPDQVSNLGREKIQKFENVAKLIKAMNNNYLQSIAGIDSPVSAVGQLSSEANDIGLFVKAMVLEQKNPLGE